jgi:CRP/FNR family transcriptional regulator
LKNLDKKESEIINSKRYEVKFRAGENILKQGTTSTHIVVLTTGSAKAYIEGFNGRNLILQIFKTWQIFGSPGLYVDNRYHYSVTALEDSTACFIDAGSIKEVFRLDPNFAESFFNLCSSSTLVTFERFTSLTQKQMHGRIADVLLYLSREIYHSNEFELLLSRQDLADFSGMSKDSAIRIIKELENEGIIRAATKKISILQPETLQQIALKG